MKLKTRISRVIVTAVIAVMFFASSAFAVIPLIYLAGSVVLHTAVVAGLTWLAYKSNGKSAINSTTGDVALGSNVVWLDLSTTNLPVQKTKDVTVKKTFTSTKTSVNANPTKYPKLKEALNPSSSPTELIPATDSPQLDTAMFSSDWAIIPKLPTVGSAIVFNGTNYNVNSITPSNASSGIYIDYPSSFVAVRMNVGSSLLVRVATRLGGSIVSGGVTYYEFSYQDYNIGVTTGALPDVPATGPEFSEKVKNPDGTIKDEYRKEFETLVKDTGGGGGTTTTPGGTTVIDQPDPSIGIGSGSTYSPPGPPTNTQITNAGGVPQGDYSVVAPTPTPLTTGQVAEGVSSGIGLSGLKDSIVAAVDRVKDAINNSGDDDDGGDDPYTPAPTSSTAYGNPALIGDFGGRLNQFFTDLRATPLFSVAGNFLNSVPAGGSPIITFEAGSFGYHTYDFSSWGAILTTLRSLVLIIFSACGVKIVTLKGGGG